MLTADDARSDLAYLRDAVETAHIDPFHHESKAQFERAIAEIDARLPDRLTNEDLYRRVAPLLVAIGDAHTGADPYTKPYREFRDANGLLFPLELRFEAGGAVVVANYGPETAAPIGASVLSVNGRTIPALVAELGRFVSAERTTLKSDLIAQDIRAYMWADGIAAPFAVTYRDRHGVLHRSKLRGTTIAAIHAWDGSNAGYSALAPYDLRFVDGNTAVLTIHSFDEPVGWNAFAARLVPILNAHATRNLVVDIRENTGGSTATSDRLLSLIAARPYRDFSFVITKVSAITKDTYGLDRYTTIYGSDAWGMENGTVIHSEVAPTPPLPPARRYRERTYVVVGSGTFSTAAIFAAAAQDAHAATIVGQESGGTATQYGERFDFELPVSHLAVSVATKYFVRPNGEHVPRGVSPDVRFEETSREAPVDAELQAILRYTAQR